MNTLPLPSSFSLLFKESPEISKKIAKDISNLEINLTEANNNVKKLLFKSIDIGDNDKAKYYSDLAISISQFVIMLNGILDTEGKHIVDFKDEKQLDLEDVGFFKQEVSQNYPAEYIKNISLWDVETNYKPVSFTLYGKTIYVSKWRDLAKILLYRLFKQSEDKFIEYVDKGTFNSQKTKCFSKSKSGMITPVQLKSKSYNMFVDIDKLLLNNKRIFKMVLEDLGFNKDDILLDIRLASKRKNIA